MPPMMETGVQWACVATAATIFVLELALIFRKPETRGKLLSGDGHFHFDKLRAEHVAGDTRGVGLVAFGLIRIAMGCFAIGSTLSRAFGWPDLPFLATFTCWSWLLLGVYMIVAGVISLTTACFGPGAQAADKSANVVHKFLWVWCQIMVTMAIFICLVVWVCLIPLDIATVGWDVMVERYFDWVSIAAHNASVVFMGIEMYLNRLTFLRAHAPFIAFYGIVYIVFAWFFFWNTGTFFYAFLDWRLLGYFTPVSYLVLLAILYVTFLGVARCTARLKRGVPVGDFPIVEGAAKS